MKLLKWAVGGAGAAGAYAIYKYSIGRKAKGEDVFVTPEKAIKKITKDNEQAEAEPAAKPKRTRELRRLRNVADNPRVSLVVDVWDEDWTRLAWVIVEGRAGILTTDLERAPALAALVAKYPQYAKEAALSPSDSVIVEVTPTHVFTWGLD